MSSKRRPPIDRHRVADRIDEMGFTVTEVAAAAQVSRVTLWRIITGETRRPRKNTVLALAKALRLSVEELISGGHQLDLFPREEDQGMPPREPQELMHLQQLVRDQLDRMPDDLRWEGARAAVAAMVDVLLAFGSPPSPDLYARMADVKVSGHPRSPRLRYVLKDRLPEK